LSIGIFLYLLKITTDERKQQQWHHKQVRNKGHYGVYEYSEIYWPHVKK